MSRRQLLQPVPVVAQRREREPHSLDRLGDLLTTEEAAARLRYDGPRGIANFWKWADRNRVPRLHRGSRVLWQASVLAAYLAGEKWTRNRHVSDSPRLHAVTKDHGATR